MTIEEVTIRLHEMANLSGSDSTEVVIHGRELEVTDFYYCDQCGRIEIGPATEIIAKPLA